MDGPFVMEFLMNNGQLLIFFLALTGSFIFSQATPKTILFCITNVLTFGERIEEITVLSHWCKCYHDTGLGWAAVKKKGSHCIMEQKWIAGTHYSGLERNWIISLFSCNSPRLVGGIKLLPQLFKTIS